MKNLPSNPEDAALSRLLRGSRANPPMPPRFQQSVWRRIEAAEDRESAAPSWLNSVVGWLMRPQLAFAVVAVLVVVGASLGVRSGTQTARYDAQARYLAAVAPNELH